MVNIKLDSRWSLTSDSKQWILNLDEKAQTFHTSLESAIQSYFERRIRGSDARTISGLLEYHKRCIEGLNRVLTLFKIEIASSDNKLFEVSC